MFLKNNVLPKKSTFPELTGKQLTLNSSSYDLSKIDVTSFNSGNSPVFFLE